MILKDLIQTEQNISIEIDTDKIENWDKICSELYEIQQKRKHYQAREKELLEAVKAMANNQPLSRDGFKLDKIVRKGTINIEMLAELERVDVEIYRNKDIECWKFGKDIKSERWL